MNKIYFNLILLLLLKLGYSQEGFPVYNAYLFENGYTLHPSLAGINDCGHIRFTGRTQWSGVEDAPQTFALAYDQKLFGNSSLGVLLHTDKNGYSERNAIQLTYSHQVNFSDPRYQNNFLKLAVSYNGYNFNTRYDKIYIDQPLLNDPSLVTINNFWEHNLNVSFSYIYKEFSASLTAYSLLPFYKNKESYFETTNLRNYIITLSNKFRINETITYEPSINFVAYENYNKRVLDLNQKVYFNTDNEYEFWFALGYRALLDNGFDNLNLTPMIGIEKDRFKLGYSYDINIGNVVNSFPASHQFSLGVDLFCND